MKKIKLAIYPIYIPAPFMPYIENSIIPLDQLAFKKGWEIVTYDRQKGYSIYAKRLDKNRNTIAMKTFRGKTFKLAEAAGVRFFNSLSDRN